MGLETFRLPQFGSYEYLVYEKLQNKFKAISNNIAYGGNNTPVFNKMYLDAPLCPVWQIKPYTSENIKNGYIFVSNDVAIPHDIVRLWSL